MDLPAFKQFLHDKNFRFTAQRMAVLKAVARNNNSHPSAWDVYVDVKAERPGIGISTVYKTLHLLEREGVLYRITGLNNTAHYAFAGSRPAHCRMVCMKCGKVAEAQESGVRQAIELLQGCSRFKIRQGVMSFFGVCEKCLPAEERNGC
jgi:Fur family ferric uptake transcriptional regulator